MGRHEAWRLPAVAGPVMPRRHQLNTYLFRFYLPVHVTHVTRIEGDRFARDIGAARTGRGL